LRRFFIIGFLIVLAFDTLAQISFKLAGTGTHPEIDFAWIMRVACNPWTYGAIAGYVGAFITWMTLLKHAPVGPAFAATHLYVVSVAIVSFLFFGEKFSIMQIIGGLLVVAGIVVLAYGEGKGEISVVISDNKSG
jgi:drug/metabolite transporter (DMT)-like permease